jgi:hypothetical protein
MKKFNNRPNVFRNYLALFAKIFSEIYVSQPKSNGIYMKKVPIHFGPAMKHHRTTDENYKNKRTDISLPVMGFSFLAPQFDSSRMLSKTEQLHAECNSALSVQGFPVPYIIPMTLYIKTKTVNELLEILEQILPYFSPSLSFMYNIYNYGNIAFQDEVTLTLSNSVERLDNWEDPVKRDIEWQIDFEFKAYFFKLPKGNYINYPIVDKDDNIIIDYADKNDEKDEEDKNVSKEKLVESFKLYAGVYPISSETDCIDLSTVDIDEIFSVYETREII